MGFSGTQEKCKACDKTVYIIEMVTADGVAYHKNCFRCKHCNGKLVMGNFSSLDGILYCKPHFEQFFRESGSFKIAQGSQKPNLQKAPSKVSTMFSGTVDKCSSCKKTVYPLEKVTVEGEFYHKSCFRCAHGGCSISPSNYAALDGVLYCKPHFAQLFKERGSYNTLNKTSSLKRRNSGNVSEDDPKSEAEPETEAEKTEAEAEAEPEPEPETEAKTEEEAQ